MAPLGLGTGFYGVGPNLGDLAGTDFLPPDNANLAIWLRNNTSIAAERWNDVSGNDRDAVQADSAVQASLSGGGLNFDSSGDSDFYEFPTTYLNAGGTNAWVLSIVFARDGGAADKNTIIGGADQDEYILIHDEETIFVETKASGSPPSGQGAVQSKFIFPTDTWADGVKMAMTITKSAAGAFVFYKNGVSLTPSSTVNPANIGENLRVKHLGAREDGTSSDDDHFHGVIYEFLFYTSFPATQHKLANLNSYLVNKFGL